MIVRHEPEVGDARQWEFNPRRVRASRAEMVERQYGKGWQEYLVDLMRGSMAARRVLLWDLTRLEHPGFPFRDTPDFYADEFTVEFTKAELEAMREETNSNSALGEGDRRVMLAALDSEIEKAPTGVDGGKAPSETD